MAAETILERLWYNHYEEMMERKTLIAVEIRYESLPGSS